MTKDLVRQLVVAVSSILAVVGAFIGSGAAGGIPIAEAAGGALSADSTRLAPAGPAFAIWTVIYAGLLAYAVWQFLPGQKTDARQRRLGYPVAASLILNAAWILSVQAGLLWVSVVVIVLLLVVLAYAFRVTLASRPRNIVETIVADGTVGLYLGWVCVAATANLTAALVASGFDGFGVSPDLWAVAVLTVVGVVGVLLAVRSNGRLAPAIAIAWGLSWVVVSRLTGDLLSPPAAIAAGVVATTVLITSITLRLRAPSMGMSSNLA